MTEARMLYVAGSESAFRCACDCNVFTRDLARMVGGEWVSVYVCNACNAEYGGIHGNPATEDRQEDIGGPDAA